MRKGEIWNLINKIIWSEDKRSFQVIIVDRLEPNEERRISGDEIKKVHSSGLIELVDGGFIPVHRVIEIRYKDKILFTRKNGYRKLVDGKMYIPSITNLYYGGYYFI